jgi:hypothetical protein
LALCVPHEGHSSNYLALCGNDLHEVRTKPNNLQL